MASASGDTSGGDGVMAFARVAGAVSADACDLLMGRVQSRSSGSIGASPTSVVVNSAMMDEWSFRSLADVNEAAKRLRRVIEDRIHEDGEKLFDDDKVRIQIEDAFLREYAKDLVQKDCGIVDTSFNRAIIVLSGDKFLALVFEILPASARKKIDEELVKHKRDLNCAANQNLFRIFIEQAVKGAGSEVGKQAVTLQGYRVWKSMRKIREHIMTEIHASSCSMPEFHSKILQRDHADPNAIPLCHPWYYSTNWWP